MTTVGDAQDDDPAIADDERLLRRVHPSNIVRDDNQQRWRPSSAAFDDADDGISVFLSSVVRGKLDRSEADVLIDYPTHSLVALTAGAVRHNLDPPLGAKRDPDPPGTLPHLCSPAHALVVGVLPGKAGRSQHRRPLAAQIAREWVVARPPAIE